MRFSFKPVSRPDPIEPDFNLDEELGKNAEDAGLTLHFINMVIVKGNDLSDVDVFDKSDPYCSVTVGEITDNTGVIKNDLNPVWNEKMQFFVPKKPKSMLIQVFDKDDRGKDDLIGKYTFNFDDMFEKDSEFDGQVNLMNGKKPSGAVTLRVACRILKPIETEIKLGHTEKQLACKIAEKEATEAVLDESEKLRKDAVNQLSEKEQEIVKKAEELAEQQLLHNTELSEKEKDILEKANDIESKIKEIEEAQIAVQAAELAKKETETRLTEAEKEILRKGEELEEKEKLNAAALTEKEKKLLESARELEEKEKANNEIKMDLEKVDALKREIENQLTSTGLALQEKEMEAKQSQMDRQKTQDELELSKKTYDAFKSETTNEISEVRAALKKEKAELDALTNKFKTLENENRMLKDDLAMAQAEANKKGCFGFC